MTRVCDYENSRYRYEFWEGHGRQYEDLAERIALRALLPARGATLLEVGAGYGRLTPLYHGYHRVVLVDYARSQLEEAVRYLAEPDRYILVVADVYHLPFVAELFDAVTMVRVMHHLSDVRGALAEVQRVMRSQGVAVIEHANKRNWKAMARWVLGCQPWNPFDCQPVEFVEMNFDFHPAWVSQQLHAAGFAVETARSLSHFRLPVLKRVVPAAWLAALDGLVQPTGRWCQLTPSIMVRARARKPPGGVPGGFFSCPVCRSHDLIARADGVDCPQCACLWPLEGGIYDFRNPKRRLDAVKYAIS